jgi:hypothetical protein
MPFLLSATEGDDPFAPFLPKDAPADPFAPKAPPSADPFAPATPPKPADPFAPSAPKAPTDPFATKSEAADPFAATQGSPISSAPARSLGALKEGIQGHFWSWKGPNTDTLVVFQPDGTLITREKKKSRWEPVDGATVKVTYPNQVSVQIAFDDTLTGFVESGAADAIKGQRGNPLPAPPKAVTDPSKMHARDKLVIDPDKIALSDPWMPHNIHSRKVQLQALGMYSEKVLNHGSGTPDAIWGPVTWLLPLSKAVGMLPRGSYKLRSERADRLCWPMGISIHFYNVPRGMSIPDAGGLFDEIHFITDAAERVISVQLSNKRGASPWDGGPDGTMNPYYNFLYDRANAAGGRPVQYEVRSAGSGVSRVKIQCGSEVNHWYLTAPLAEMFLEISQKIGAP